MKRLAYALVLAGSASALTGVSKGAYASPTRASDKLTLNIITPDMASISDRLSLDVSYRGEAVETVELYLDNALVAQRRILASQTRGILSFSLDTVLLTAGTHDVTVRAFGIDGKASSVSSKLKIPAADLTAPVRIAYPQNGVQVNGVVPIRVTLEDTLRNQKPYVTFFVDKELKLLRNYPPYEYNWDTTRTSNGWHLLEAWTSTEDSLTPSKSRPVHVNVNNATGETRKLNTIVDLSKDPAVGQPAPAVKPTKPVGNPSTSAGQVNPGVTGRELNIGAAHPQTLMNESARTAMPTGNGIGSLAAHVSEPASRGRHSIMPIVFSPKMQGGAVVEPKEQMPTPSAKAQHPTISDSGITLPIMLASRGGSPATTAVKPDENMGGLGQRTVVSPRLNIQKDTTRLRKGSSLIVPGSGSFDVAFNGTPIFFDVQPRIQDGMKLAPFRQIFEHTGGRLYWFGGSAQTVRAVNDTREIEIKIGDENALVNNHILKMEHKPFIDGGRTIVPLTFIRDSMDVKVTYDETTGHLLIESKK